MEASKDELEPLFKSPRQERLVPSRGRYRTACLMCMLFVPLLIRFAFTQGVLNDLMGDPRQSPINLGRFLASTPAAAAGVPDTPSSPTR